MWIQGSWSLPPASRSSTRLFGSALSRLASTQPAEPAPTITKSTSAVACTCFPRWLFRRGTMALNAGDGQWATARTEGRSGRCSETRHGALPRCRRQCAVRNCLGIEGLLTRIQTFPQHPAQQHDKQQYQWEHDPPVVFLVKLIGRDREHQRDEGNDESNNAG